MVGKQATMAQLVGMATEPSGASFKYIGVQVLIGRRDGHRFVLLSVLTKGMVLGRIVDFGWTGSEIPMSCMRQDKKYGNWICF